MAFSSAFKAIADDPWGEALQVRVSLRVDTPAGSNQLVTITDQEGLIETSSIVRRRERTWGVVQGQEWSVRLSHANLTFNPSSTSYFASDRSLLWKWACLEVGFPEADEWEVVAQGKIQRTRVSTDLSVVFEVRDALMDAIDFEIPRDVFFDDAAAWVSEMHEVKRSSGSKDYDNTNNPLAIIAVSGVLVSDETFSVEFVSPTAYEIRYEDGTLEPGGPWNINANHDVTSNLIPVTVVRIYTAGWDQTAGAYAIGDRFVFYTSKQRSSVSPVSILMELLGSAFANLSSYDVKAGASRNWFHDISVWSAYLTEYSAVKLKGFWPAGTNVMDMAQGALKAINGTLYPTLEGQVGIWTLSPERHGSTGPEVSGDPANPKASILEATRAQDSRLLTNRVTVAYKSLVDGSDAEITVVDEDSDYRDTPTRIETGWWVTATQMESTANLFLNRFKNGTDEFEVRGTLTNLLSNELADLVLVTEPFLSETLRKVQVIEMEFYPLENETRLVCVDDPVVVANYARIGISVVEGADLVF